MTGLMKRLPPHMRTQLFEDYKNLMPLKLMEHKYGFTIRQISRFAKAAGLRRHSSNGRSEADPPTPD